MSWLNTKVPPLVVLGLVALAMIVLAPGFPRLDAAPLVRGIIALAMFGGGVAMVVTAIRTFRRAKTTANPIHLDAASALVTNGIFAYSRNPMYAGMALFLIALAVALASPMALVGVAVFVGYITQFQIRPEEAMLRAKFGEAYSHYCGAVRRWV